MKKLIFVLHVLFIVFTSFSTKQEDLMKWYDWNEGYSLAIKKNKIVLVDAYTDWCGWCKKMDRDTYANPEVIKRLNKDFIAIKFNPEKQGIIYDVDGQKFSPAEMYSQLSRGEKTGFPTTYVIITDKKQLFLQAGYMGPETFIEMLDNVLKERKNK